MLVITFKHFFLLCSNFGTTDCRLKEDDKSKSKESPESKPPSEERSPGWFSKLLGVQPIQPMKASHSSMLADKEVLYELASKPLNCLHIFVIA